MREEWIEQRNGMYFLVEVDLKSGKRTETYLSSEDVSLFASSGVDVRG